MPRFKTIPRRAVLRGSCGAAIALPFLEGMLTKPVWGQDQAPPKRLLVWSQANGTVADNWVCKAGPGGQTDFELSRILAPLARHKSDMIVLQNLWQKGGHAHHYCSGLTGRGFNDDGYPVLSGRGISLDQYIAQKLGSSTPIPSLELMAGVKDGGVLDALETIACVSWAGDRQPVAAELNPFSVFKRLFPNGSGAGDAEMDRLVHGRRSILDSAKTRITQLQARVGTADRSVLQNYFDSLRDMETQIAALEAAAKACSAPMIPEDPTQGGTPWWMISENMPQVLDLYAGLIATAFACDLTRVVTLTQPNNRQFPYVDGVPAGIDWHGFSHEVETGGTENMTRVDTYMSTKLAELLDRLKATPDADGKSLLHHSLVMTNNEYGSNGPVEYLPPGGDGKRNNITHYTMLMPYLLFGQVGGALQTGRNLVFPLTPGKEWAGEGPHHTRLLVSVLNLLGFPDTTFGDPEFEQGALSELV